MAATCSIAPAIAPLRHLAKAVPEGTDRSDPRLQTRVAALEIRHSSAAAPSTVVRSRSAKLTVSLTASVVFAVAVPVRVAAARAARMYLRMAVLLSSDLNRLSSDIRLVLQPYGASHNLIVQVQNSDQAHP